MKLELTIIFSKIDYCNAVFTGLNKNSVRQLQLIQNAAAGVLTNTRKLGQDYCTFPEPELSIVKQHLVTMLLTCGTNFLNN